MKVYKWRPLLSIICAVWFLFALFTFNFTGFRYIGKSYFDSDEFLNTLSNFQTELGPQVLNPAKAEELKKNLSVSQVEVEEHRNRFGSLGAQITNIKDQYEERITEAEQNNAPELKKKLEMERDAKIKDITSNFESDEHVAEKILEDKKKLVDKYIAAVEGQKEIFKSEYPYFAYELTNLETGKVYRSGDITESSIYKIKFSQRDPLVTWNISEQFNHIFYESDVYVNTDMYNNGVVEETVSNSDGDGVKIEGGPTKSIAKKYAYSGTMTIPKASMKMMGLSSEYENFQLSKYTFFIIWITGILAAILAWRWRYGVRSIFSEARFKKLMLQWEIDLQLIVALFTGVLFWSTLWLTHDPIGYVYTDNYISFYVEFLFGLLIMLMVGVFFFVQVIWLFGRVDTYEKWSNNWKSSYMRKMVGTLQDLFLNRTIALQSLVLIAAAFFGGGSVVVSLRGGGVPVLLTFVCIVVGIPSLFVFLSRMGYLNRIMKDTEAMAAGRLNRDVKVRGKSPLAKHAENLNHLREGVRTSMHEQAKSERLKTELITNVSHDLRTPLTSIITYTDLLKNPELTDEERRQYIHILDKKSDRLKVLIEDLFEVSKMASGNIELNKSRVDLTQLVQQAVGEHKEDLTKAKLDLRMTMPSDTMYAYVDGQKWWRLIDNLIVNVLKYALEGTRVYVTMKRTVDGNAEFTVKNVAKYEISENADELFERFKRADASRHTEGSGLGLAIAQSIVDLHGARMSIEVEGDLFKVIVKIQTV